MVPEFCPKTGRLLTEWFEYPEYTREEVERLACEYYGIAFEDMPKAPRVGKVPEDRYSAQLYYSIKAFVDARMRKDYPSSMPLKEIHFRLNEASKLVDPKNLKFLPEHITERTGLELNPLWMLEVLVRSGTLSAKEQIAALKELAQYTHSKAPSINHNTNTTMTPEDWLIELARDDYPVLEDAKVIQPKQPKEAGMGPEFEVKRLAREREAAEYLEILDADYQVLSEEMDMFDDSFDDLDSI